METIKDRILEFLQDKNLSIGEFCKMAGIGKNAINELDKFTPSLTNILKIADCLNVSLDYLADLPENENTILTNYTIKFYDNLNEILEQQQISKNKFLKDLNLSSDAFTRWKRGATPYFSTLVDIAKYLNVSLDYLIGRSEY